MQQVYRLQRVDVDGGERDLRSPCTSHMGLWGSGGSGGKMRSPFSLPSRMPVVECDYPLPFGRVTEEVQGCGEEQGRRQRVTIVLWPRGGSNA